MNHWWLAYDALIVVVGAVTMALLMTVRSRRDFLGPFALFHAVFTAGLLVALSRGYLTLNVQGALAVPVFLSYGLGTLLGCAAVVCAAWVGHRGLAPRPALRPGIVAAALALAALLMVTPLGVRFDPSTASYRLLPGYFVAAAIQLVAFVYVLRLLLRAARTRPDRYDALFFRGMAAFAAIGLLESAAGLVANWRAPVGRLDAQGEEFLYSSVPYLLFSLFLGFYLVRLLHQPEPRPGDARATAAMAGIGLSVREQEVLGLVLDGLNNKRIAVELDISVATVKTHLYNIFRKANVGSRFELARRLERGSR